jgi:integration host factor subunit beta
MRPRTCASASKRGTPDRMIRSELVTRIAEQNPHLFAKEVEAVVSAILDRIATALAEGDRVELRDFGTFCVRDREARTGRNPRTGKAVLVQARTTVHFKPGKAMRTRLNLEKADPEQEAEQILRAS